MTQSLEATPKDARLTDPAVANEREEPVLHTIARESVWILRWIVGLSLVATAVMMATFFFWALVPGIILIISYGLLVMATDLERRTNSQPDGEYTFQAVELGNFTPEERAARAEARAKEDQIQPVIDNRVTRITIEVLCGAIFLGVVYAGVLFGWQLFAIGALVLVAYIIFVMAPVWLGWMEDEVSDGIKKIEGTQG
jgi:hypothetical protein